MVNNDTFSLHTRRFQATNKAVQLACMIEATLQLSDYPGDLGDVNFVD